MGDRYNQKMVSHVERGRSSLRIDGLAAAAKALDVSTDWLLGLTDDPTPGTQRGTYMNDPAQPIAEERVYHAERHDESAVCVDPNDTHPTGAHRSVEILELASAAGDGTEVYDENPISVMWFQEDWLRKKGIDPTWCNVINVAGDSMEPTLPDGCSILVDRSRTELHNHHIYVMRNEDGLIVKRVQHSPKHGWLLISDNRTWPPEVMDKDTDIIGEVKWYAVTL